MIDLSRLSAGRIREGIARKEFTAAEVTAAAYERIEALDERLNAFNSLSADLAEEAAARIDGMVAAGDDLPPLAGVPLGIKDNMNLVGTRTTCSSRILEPYESVYDCTAVRRALDAGAIPIGKCNMDEFAFGSSTENSAFGPSRNPWDLDRVPGGSSGGSAVAVSSGEVCLSLGSDTGGSIRQPGALCGVVAVKPTYGRVSRYGLVAFASSLDQIGPFSKTVGESALLLNAICGKDPYDATSVDRPAEDFTAGLHAGAKGLRVGVVRPPEPLMGGVDAEVSSAMEKAVETYVELGAEAGEVELPSIEYGLSAYYIIAPAEASSNLARFDGVRYGFRSPGVADSMDLYMRTRAEGFGQESVRRIMLGTYALSAGYHEAYYGQAQKARTLIIRDFEKAFEDFDVLLTPTSPSPAFRIGEKSDDPVQMYLSDVFTIPVNLAGVCGVSVPCGLTADGLPIGLQLIGSHFAESTLLRAAAAFEEASGFDTTPPIVEGLRE